MKYCSRCASELADDAQVCWFCKKNVNDTTVVQYDKTDVVYEDDFGTDFETELENMPTADLILILEDQIDLYSYEEIEAIRAEIASRESMDVMLAKEKMEIDRKNIQEESAEIF